MASCMKPLSNGGAFLKPHSLRASFAVFKTATQAVQVEPAFAKPTHQELVAPAELEIDFDDPRTAFASKTSSNLLRTLCTLGACRIKPIVHNANSLLKFSRTCLGQKLTNSILETTFFNHFCAGTNVETIKPTLAYLRQRGILPILNYAAEEDLKHANNGEQDSVKSSEEAKYNWQHSIFMRSIKDCDNTTPAKGFVGIKITGLTQPALLERMSEVLMQTGSHLDRGRSSGNLTGFMKNQLDPAEFEAFQNLWSRLDKLALAVQQKGNMRMMVDAEQTYLQVAIDALTIALQQRYNQESSVIMNTYQCYLKCSAARIEADMHRAYSEGWVWGAKTVRGAYMHQERARALEQGYESPIHNTLADTHDNYNRCVANVLAQVRGGGRGPELLVASHNQASVEKALHVMHRLGLRPNSPESGVYFGQLLGMADNLSFPLGAEGYNVYKICAYGSVNETIAFLLRRALENSDAMGGVSKEINMITRELFRRMNPMEKKLGQHASEPALQHA